MKKIISVMLALVMLLSMASVAVTAADEDELVITVANDLHYSLKEGTFTGEDFAHINITGQMYLESILIIEEFLRQAAENESDCLLLPGDLVDLGTTKNFTGMSQLLREFEQTSGKQVYVVPGNHEFYAGGTREEFVGYFYEFGYSEAIARDTNSASYVAELNDEYRLLAIDGGEEGSGGAEIDEERAAWIEAQVKQAHQEGKKLIAMNHFNLLPHYILGDTLHSGAIVDESLGIAELFASYDVKYTFCGHTHEQDIACYTGKNGNTIYDIVTSTLNSYPCPYRVATFGEDKVKLETRYVTSISGDLSFLEDRITEYCYELVTTDFYEYAEQCLDIGLEKVVDSYVDAAVIKNLAGINEENNPEVSALIDNLIPEFRELIYIPFYEKDAAEPGKSIETMAKNMGMELAETEIESFADLASKVYKEHVLGDESRGILDPVTSAANTAVTVIFYELLKDVTGEEYTVVLDLVCSILGVEEYMGAFNKFAGDGIARLEGINYFVAGVVSTLLLQFTTDAAPSDNNATLPGYTQDVQQQEVELSFWDKLVGFFRDFFSYILRILGF